MSQESFNSEASSTNTTATTSTAGQDPSSQSSPTDRSEKIQSAIQSLSSITPIPPSILSSQNPVFALLHDPEISSQVTSLLRHPDSGAGDNQLCRWFYDTFQANAPQLQLLVLRFLPIIAGLYLSRIPQRKPLAGFEAVLLALYAYETTTRNGQAITVNIPNLSNSSIYHETKDSTKNMSSELNIAVISPSLEPHGTVRSTRRARIVGVALELYFSKIANIPLDSKIDFCEFCELWAGQDGDVYKENDVVVIEEKEEEVKEEKNDVVEETDKEEGNEEKNDVVEETDKEEGNEEKNDVVEKTEKEEVKEEKNDVVAKEKVEKKEGRIDLPWELMQPVLRILSHCLMGPQKDEKLFEAACGACRCLYARSLHDINSKAILATGSLLKLSKLAKVSTKEIDYTEIKFTSVISLSISR
ncbi:uncharacterized protein [Euphorbia lathyris]|uniref:uncharacterized protein n=1 Tax=Euphorbia lathyris TaxID=212925 RepID=UPI00331427C8